MATLRKSKPLPVLRYHLPLSQPPKVGWQEVGATLLTGFVMVAYLVNQSDSFVYSVVAFQASLVSLILLKVLPRRQSWPMWVLMNMPYLAITSLLFPSATSRGFFILMFIVGVPALRLTYSTVTLDTDRLKLHSTMLFRTLRKREVPYWDIEAVDIYEDPDRQARKLPPELQLTVEIRAGHTEFAKNDRALQINFPLAERDDFIAELNARVEAVQEDRARALLA